MSDDIKQFNAKLIHFIDRQAMLIGHIGIGASLILAWAFTDLINTEYLWILVIGLGLSILIAVMRFFNILGLNDKPILFVLTYHFLAALMLIYLVPILSPFAFVWVLLVFSADYYYRKVGIILSLLLFVVVTQLSIIVNDLYLDPAVLVLVIVQTMIVAALAYMLSATQSLRRQEHEALQKTNDREQFEHRRIVSLINNMGDAVITTDKNGVIKLYNAAALALFDTNTSLENQTIKRKVNIVDEHNKSIDLIQEAKKKSAHFTRRDLRLIFSENDYMNLYVSVSPVKLGYLNKGETGFTIIMRDITKEKSLEEERDEFISVVSHELRTPVTVAEGNISNALMMNDRTVKDKEINNALKLAHDQVIFLADLINDLATLSRAERNQLAVDPEEIDPNQVLKDLEKEYTSQAKRRGLGLTTKAIGDLPNFLSSKLYVMEILQNFITNSLKYTKKGSITITAEPGESGGVIFRVKDTGIGISKSDRKHLFDKFFRSEDFRTRESSGTGLGLYVTAKLAQKLGSTIDVSSKLNEGSMFSIEFKSLHKRRHKKED